MNKSGLIMGSIDEPLNTQGLMQAHKAALILKKENFDIIISSPRQRALQTAKQIASATSKPCSIDENLTERVWGEAEGKPYSFCKSLFDDTHTPLGAETFSDFKERIVKAIVSHLKQSQNKTALFVSHGGVFKVLCHVLGYSDFSSTNGVPYFFQPPKNETHPWLICALREGI